MLGNVIGIGLTIAALLVGAQLTGTMGIALLLLGCMAGFMILAPILGAIVVKTAVLVEYVRQKFKDGWLLPFSVIIGATSVGFALLVGIGVATAMSLPDDAINALQKSPLDYIGTYEHPGPRK